MNSYLTETGYILNVATGVWSRQDYTGIAYSDGDEVEQRIASIINEASDLGVLSSELRQHCTDWPSLYHLSGTRANILRPFENNLHGDILEIGAGCGAITRYLGECGGNVLALEGSPRRAAVARARTRDLQNVTVVSDRFDLFSADRKFDAITLIGVLEYANLFTPGESPALSMLERVRALLKPEGKLFIAIENQLGLKYFAGAPEDHLGQPMYGIEGRYRNNQPQTFGRIILAEMLKEAGFSACDFLAPFPDYKLPVSVITERGFKTEKFDAAAFAWQSVRRDPQLPSILAFSPELVWPTLAQNDLALDLANSFLIVASSSKEPNLESSALAWHFTTERKKEFCKKAVFLQTEEEKIRVSYQLLAQRNNKVSSNTLLKFDLPNEAKYIFGTPLSQELITIVTRDGWCIEEVVAFMKRYLSIVASFVDMQGDSINILSPDTLLPGYLFDAIPQNIMITSAGSWRLIDKEWEATESVRVGFLCFRSLITLFHNVTKFGHSADEFGKTYINLIQAVMNGLDWLSDKGMIISYANLEAAIQTEVSGRAVTMDWLGNPISRLNNLNQAVTERDQVVTERDEQIASLSQVVIGHNTQIASLSQTVAERDGQIVSLAQEVAALRNSASWRLTKPLRTVKHFARVARSGLKQLLRSLWQLLPLSIRWRTRIRTALFRYIPVTKHGQSDVTGIPPIFTDLQTSRAATGYQEEYRSRFGFALNQLNPDFVPLAGDHVDLERATVKVIAFYLPQFHPIPENDKNWGLGFTEWTNVSKAVPQFVGHYQPRLSGELGFYDLRLKDIQKRQIELARQYGIQGFCYHHYWFDGKRVLEKPFQQVLDDPTLDLPFCLCWANENWTKRWDGSDEDIILAQNHSPEDDLRFFEDILPALKDPRYIRIDNRPLLIVYRPGLLPDPAATARRWRQAAAEADLPGLYIASAATFGFEDYTSIGYDGLVQFPPHNISALEVTTRQTLLNPHFSGRVYDYNEYAKNALKSLNGKQHTFPCVMMNWDNEARKPGRGDIFVGCTPKRYKNWLRHCFDFVRTNNTESERLVFVNAWNEWAEGTYLEPDRRYGYAYLHATATLIRDCYNCAGVDKQIQAKNARFQKKHDNALIAHWYYFDLFDELKNCLEKNNTLDVFMTIPDHMSPEQIDIIASSLDNVYLIPVRNRGRDILPFLTVLPVIESFGYRYFVKVHSKKSMHRSDGNQLRKSTLRELLDAKTIKRVFALFDAEPEVGLVGPSGTLLSLVNDNYLINNQNHLRNCLNRLKLADASLNFDFIAGSMFWARSDALQKLSELALTEDDFEEELGQLDGTLAHALERMFSYLALRVGYRTLTLDQLR